MISFGDFAASAAALSSAPASSRWRSGSRNEAVGQKPRIALGERGEISRPRQGAREQVAHLGVVPQERGGGGQALVCAKRLRQCVEDVSAARRVINRRTLGDALKERRHAGLNSAPGA